MKLKILVVILVLGGVGLISYPFISNMYNQHLNNKEISNYDSAIGQLGDEQSRKIIEKAEEYNRSHPNIMIKDSFSGEPSPESREYENTLDPAGDGSMGYIEIPKINVRLMIFHGTDESVLEHACGHVEGTSLPVGGKNTHCILSAHRGLPSAKLFTDLDQVDKNDTFIISVMGNDLYYKVDRIITVKPDELSDLKIEPNEDRVTLLTCTPYGVNSHRLLVSGCRTEHTVTKKAPLPVSVYVIMVVICAALILLVAFVNRYKLRK